VRQLSANTQVAFAANSALALKPASKVQDFSVPAVVEKKSAASPMTISQC
jgi:hypothetical protein